MEAEHKKKPTHGKVAPGQMALLPDEVGYDVCMLEDPRHEVFCREVAIRNNGTQAYLVAFPDCKITTAAANSSRLLRKAKVKKRVAEIRKGRLEKLEVTHEKVLQELAKMAFVNPQDFYNTDGSLKPIVDLDPDVAASLESVKVKTKRYEVEVEGDEEGTKKDVILAVDVAEIKHTSKKGALETLAKMQGYYAPERKELTGLNGAPVNVNHMSELSRAELMAIANLGRSDGANAESP